MRFGQNPIGRSSHLLTAGTPHATLFNEHASAVDHLITEAAAQNCDIVFAYYPERSVLLTGINGQFDVDRALESSEESALLDLLTPLGDTEYTDLRDTIAADHQFAVETDQHTPRQHVREWMDSAEHSDNAVEYYELVDDTILHERTYHNYDTSNLSEIIDPTADPDIEQALEDADVDVEEIIEELGNEAEADKKVLENEAEEDAEDTDQTSTTNGSPVWVDPAGENEDSESDTSGDDAYSPF